MAIYDKHEFETYYKKLSSDEQYELIVPLIAASDDIIKWRLNLLCKSISTLDLITLLPPEIQIKIFLNVDGPSLLNASQVCSKWNKLIKCNERLWRLKSKELGVNIDKKPSAISWSQAYILSLKEKYAIQTDRAFKSENFTLQNMETIGIKLVDYQNGYLCTVTEDNWIAVFQFEWNAPVLSFQGEWYIFCIKFLSGVSLICGLETGELVSYDMTETIHPPSAPGERGSGLIRRGEGERRGRIIGGDGGGAEVEAAFSLLQARFQQHTSCVLSVDAKDRLELVASTSYDNTARLWCLRTGRALRSFDVLIFPYSVILVLCHASAEKLFLVVLTGPHLYRFEWPRKGADPWGDLSCVRPCESQDFGNDCVLFGHVVDNRLGVVSQYEEGKHCTLRVFDLASMRVLSEVELRLKVRWLLGLGDRLALLLAAGLNIESNCLVVVDLALATVVMKLALPGTRSW